jgi:hypothetical protein
MNRIRQIFIGGKSAGRCRATLENRLGEIARLGVDPLRVLALPVARRAMAANAVTPILLLTGCGVAFDVADASRLSRKNCRGDEEK